MKLELKHLAPYLPYQTPIIYEEMVWTGSHPQEPSHIETVETVLSLYNINNVLNWEYPTLILRPLSELTKEILVDGKVIKPLEIIGQDFIEDGFIEDGVFGWGQPTGGDDEQDYYLTIELEKDILYLVVWCGEKNEGGYVSEQYELSYRYFNMLLSWHFDVFGLIEKGLAIDINTLK